jgi:hypothetical protein
MAMATERMSFMTLAIHPSSTTNTIAAFFTCAACAATGAIQDLGVWTRGSKAQHLFYVFSFSPFPAK